MKIDTKTNTEKTISVIDILIQSLKKKLSHMIKAIFCCLNKLFLEKSWDTRTSDFKMSFDKAVWSSLSIKRIKKKVSTMENKEKG